MEFTTGQKVAVTFPPDFKAFSAVFHFAGQTVAGTVTDVQPDMVRIELDSGYFVWWGPGMRATASVKVEATPTLNNYTRNYRKDIGESQKGFAARLGCCYTWLSRLENCRVESNDPILKQVIPALSQVTGAPKDWLLLLSVEKREAKGQAAFVCRVRDIKP